MTYGNFKGSQKKRPINSDTLDIILSVYPDISAEWLLSGKGNMIIDNRSIAIQSNDSVVGIPLVSIDAAAGFGSSTFAISNQDIQALYQVPDFTEIDFMIRVKGNSMYPKYSSGDVIACRILRNSQFIEWIKPHLVSTTEHGLIVKRLRKSKAENCITAISDNKEYDPFDIPMNEVTGIAIIIGVIRLE